jgi:hypothetical protein
MHFSDSDVGWVLDTEIYDGWLAAGASAAASAALI